MFLFIEGRFKESLVHIALVVCDICPLKLLKDSSLGIFFSIVSLLPIYFFRCFVGLTIYQAHISDVLSISGWQGNMKCKYEYVNS